MSGIGAGTVRIASTAMRTRFEILLCDPDTPPADLRAAGEAALEEIAQVEDWLSIYREDAILFGVNADAAQRAVRVAAPVFSLLELAQRLGDATGYAFDVMSGPLVRLWRRAGETGRLPTTADIEAIMPLLGRSHPMHLDQDTYTVGFLREGVRLDVGAIGKGYALDRAADVLLEAGVQSALLHGGTSSVIAIGHPTGQETGWNISLQHPLNPDARLATVPLANRAFGVSAVQGRVFTAEGRTFGHVIDPRTGYPVENTLLAACLAPTGTLADALSTALLVLGVAGIPTLKAIFPDVALLVAERTPDGASLTVTRSSDWPACPLSS